MHTRLSTDILAWGLPIVEKETCCQAYKSHGTERPSLPSPPLQDPAAVLSSEPMPRRIVSIIGFLLLSVGPIFPYYHLASRPHHLCPRHGIFESGPAGHSHPSSLADEIPKTGASAARGGTPGSTPPPSDDPDPHRPCTLANLTLGQALASADEPAANGAPLDVETQQASYTASMPAGRHTVLSVAPKASPPLRSSI